MSNGVERRDPGWRSKAKWSGKAHYVLASGETACANKAGPYGMLMKSLFKTSWKDRDPNDHLCRWCAVDHPEEQCECGICRVRRAEVESARSRMGGV